MAMILPNLDDFQDFDYWKIFKSKFADKCYCWVYQWKKLKPVNIWHSYKQEGNCLVQFVRLATTLLKDEESAPAPTFLSVTLPKIFTDFILFLIYR